MGKRTMRIMLLIVAMYSCILVTGEPNPPTWPSSVIIISPYDNMNTAQAKINQIYQKQGGHSPEYNGHFSPYRYAIMFKPGTYSVTVPVGFYTSIYGLGQTPQQVVFQGGSGKGVFCEEGSYLPDPGALNNFWRSAENFMTKANYQWFSGSGNAGMLWAVSQASPIRRIIVQNSLVLFEYVPPYDVAGMASGGFMANVKVGGVISTGSQQQWISRNSECAKFKDGVWNMVMVGCTGTPSSHCGEPKDLSKRPYVVINTTEIIAEKPFISITSSDTYNLHIPPVKINFKGVDHTISDHKIVNFEKVYVVKPGDTAATVNKKLQDGLHVVISPGVYRWTEPINIVNHGQVILCLGIATLVSSAGNTVINVQSGLEGVRVAGCLLQAGTMKTKILLKWGDQGDPGNPSNPSVLSDMYARVGGPDIMQVVAEMMMQINSGNVIIDNAWLWRADHSVCGLVKNRNYPCVTALQVNGDNVHGYGIAAEHTLGNLVEWNGNGGKTYLFQAEYPYDVKQSEYTDFVAYKVDSSVTSHEGYGVGVYHYFRDYDVTVETGISCPDDLVSSFKSPLGVFLNGKGTMKHIINSYGGKTSLNSPSSSDGAHPAWYCGN